MVCESEQRIGARLLWGSMDVHKMNVQVLMRSAIPVAQASKCMVPFEAD